MRNRNKHTLSIKHGNSGWMEGKWHVASSVKTKHLSRESSRSLRTQNFKERAPQKWPTSKLQFFISTQLELRVITKTNILTTINLLKMGHLCLLPKLSNGLLKMAIKWKKTNVALRYILSFSLLCKKSTKQLWWKEVNQKFTRHMLFEINYKLLTKVLQEEENAVKLWWKTSAITNDMLSMSLQTE